MVDTNCHNHYKVNLIQWYIPLSPNLLGFVSQSNCGGSLTIHSRRLFLILNKGSIKLILILFMLWIHRYLRDTRAVYLELRISLTYSISGRVGWNYSMYSLIRRGKMSFLSGFVKQPKQSEWTKLWLEVNGKEWNGKVSNSFFELHFVASLGCINLYFMIMINGNGEIQRNQFKRSSGIAIFPVLFM